MIYILGDSFSFGWNFWKGQKNREQLVYGYHLSQKLNSAYTNLSIPGGSNWRIARLISSLKLTSDDIVIVAWTGNDRLEIGCDPVDFSPLDKVFNTYNDKIFNEHLDEPADFFQYVENTDSLYTRRIFSSLFTSSKYSDNRETKINNHNFKKMFDILYKHFYSDKWYDEMFRIMFMSSVYKLKLSGCKFLMFNTWKINYPKNYEEFNIKEYIFGPTHNMNREIRPSTWDNIQKNKYWDENEHMLVAEILYKKLKEFYDI